MHLLQAFKEPFFKSEILKSVLTLEKMPNLRKLQCNFFPAMDVIEAFAMMAKQVPNEEFVYVYVSKEEHQVVNEFLRQSCFWHRNIKFLCSPKISKLKTI